KLNNGIDKFIKLNNVNKRTIIMKILSGLHCGPSIVPLKELGFTTPLGKLQSTNGISLSENTIIIYQSSSGLFERKVRLRDL
ncbi:hypothetical protein M9195_07200, partial [Apilactobacillus sp. F1]|nr:hypothetical protein [Apilactobacillus sp. F1]